MVYRGDAATRNACPLKAACTASAHGRTVRRSCHGACLDRVRGYHATAAYRRAMRKRRGWPELTFILNAAPEAADYYHHLGWAKVENGWIWRRER